MAHDEENRTNENVGFLSGNGKNVSQRDRGMRVRTKTKAVVGITVLALLALLALAVAPSSIKANSTSRVPKYHTSDATSHDPSNQRIHFLLPASNPDVNLCKTIITSSVLDYPTPTLVGWDEVYDNPNYWLAGGSHLAKITRVSQYLDRLAPEHDEDMVMMLDAYDIWFQLSVSVLIERYHRINAEADAALATRLGRKAVQAEDIKQTILFAAGKRCAPNQQHTVACYAVPDSPIPMDVYGANTDTIIGRNKYKSHRQRFVNSGYIIGPVKDMRRLFAAAQKKRDELPDFVPSDQGSGTSDYIYHGSDQAIFSIIFGEQEYQREVMRIRHRSAWQKVFSWLSGNGVDGKPTRTVWEGTVVDNVLNPSFTHEIVQPLSGHPLEYGIGLDYWSDLGQQTVNCEADSRFLRYNITPLTSQIHDRTEFDCKMRLPSSLPLDISQSQFPLASLDQAKEQQRREDQISSDLPRWLDQPLYTNLCLGRIPAMIHHNGDKEAREIQWPDLWLQAHARTLLADAEDRRRRQSTANGEGGGGSSPTSFEEHIATAGGRQTQVGAWTDKGKFLDWHALCPPEYEPELFRDLPPADTPNGEDNVAAVAPGGETNGP